ncbi:hypothetical protein BH24ACI2_BH24ACI2_12430 [soil metagenome]|nr:peptidoglycan-binding protein [Acidobacteriota bacterium]
MKKLIFVILLSLLFAIASNSQTNPTTKPTPNTPNTNEEKPKKQIFRASKEQITQVQNMLKTKNLYNGEADGQFNNDFRASIKKYQSENGLKATGTLNRATLEKMGVALTDKQKETPVSPNSYATNDDKSDKPKRAVFRANKEQIMQAQKMLKEKAMYSGEETGKLDDTTRDGLKKFQAANALKSTGTLNQATLEKMNIELTDKQKGMPAAPASMKESTKTTAEAKPKKMIFRASKDQIMTAQKMLKEKNFYAGEETGKLDDATRDGLKKYQEANGLKVTGTLNQLTLEKMGIALTDKQKENAAVNSQ